MKSIASLCAKVSGCLKAKCVNMTNNA